MRCLARLLRRCGSIIIVLFGISDCRSHDATGVEGVFPSLGDLIFQCPSAEMAKDWISINGIEENCWGPLRRVRHLEWISQRKCQVAAEARSFVRREKMCHKPLIFRLCSGGDVGCLHGKVRCLLA